MSTMAHSGITVTSERYSGTAVAAHWQHSGTRVTTAPPHRLQSDDSSAVMCAQNPVLAENDVVFHTHEDIKTISVYT